MKAVIFRSYVLSCWNCRTRVIPRTFKGFWKVYWWRSFVEGWAKFGQRVAHGLRKQYFTPVLTCSNLSKPLQTCSQLFTPVHTCSKLFKPFHICSDLFTTVHTSETTLFAQLQFLVEFSARESCYFLILELWLVKLHISAGLIESFPTEYGLCSCNEIKMSLPLGAHA